MKTVAELIEESKVAMSTGNPAEARRLRAEALSQEKADKRAARLAAMSPEKRQAVDKDRAHYAESLHQPKRQETALEEDDERIWYQRHDQ